MKKLLFCMFALLTSASMISCNQKQEATNEAADSTKQEVAQPAAADEAPSLAAIVEKMEKEGANWTEEQWKDQMKLAMLAGKSTMVKMEELMKKMETDPAAAAEELEKLSASDEMKQFEELADKMEKIIEANPVAKKVNDDKAWQEEFAKENGIPDL